MCCHQISVAERIQKRQHIVDVLLAELGLLAELLAIGCLAGVDMALQALRRVVKAL